MRRNAILSTLLAAFLPLGLLACGGGGGGGAAGGGTGGSGTTVGTITGFGSVIVNGIEIETNTETEFEVEGRGNNATEDNLKVGMVVKVKSAIDDSGNHRAVSVEFADAVDGPIDAGSINPADTSFSVLGQKVFAAEAVFENATFATLADGNVVEVSGTRDAAGAIQATRVEFKAAAFVPAPGVELEVLGTASNVGATTFNIGTLVVSFSGVTPRNGTLANGALVEVKSTAGVVGGQLVASDVEIKPAGIGAAEDDEVEIEGFVTDFAGAGSFKVLGQAVNASGATFVNGVVGDLANGIKVEVEGSIQGGILVATKVQIKRPRNIKIEADVTAKGASSLTVLGIAVSVDSLTLFEDKRDDTRPFGLANIAVGDRVEIRAFLDGPIVVASQVIRNAADTQVLLQGTVSAFTAPTSLTILGVTVDTATDPTIEFQNINDGVIDAATFFGQLTAGATVVKARGTLSEGGIVADEVSLESASTAAARSVVSGTLTAFGSILVNGVELQTPAGTPVRIDDNPKGLDDLQVGMVAEVEVQLNDDRLTGRAEGVQVDNEIQGPVTAMNLAGGTLMVMGQTVHLNDTTVFANLNLATLAVGDILEVHGFRNADGSLRATRVELKADAFGNLPLDEQEFEVKGAIANLGAQTFTIGALTVNYAGAALDVSVAAAGGLANGLVVEVKSLQALQAGVLMADFIKAEGPELEHGVEVRGKGIVTAFTSATDFEVEGQKVTTTAQTLFKRGAAADLAEGRVVEVEGVIVNGVLVAKEVSFELAKPVKIEAVVEAAGTSSVTVAGVVIQVDNSTILRDKTGAASPFSLTSLAAGDRVDVRAFIDDSGAAVAARLEREGARTDNRVILQGPASAVTGNVVTVLGTTVDTTGISEASPSRFSDVTGADITRAQFLTQAMQAGNLVKFRGTLSGGVITWERAEIEVEHEFANDGSNEFEFEFENEVDLTPG